MQGDGSVIAGVVKSKDDLSIDIGETESLGYFQPGNQRGYQQPKGYLFR